ncbi:hypothetical protein CLOBOL_00020 [Enterocloster bolteae ATCC BAA-613]|uniref:Uncharacterized protein n=1 Tax=Enterocloster bolteae (strain ATCC BAA-613 / DSM 15670 / CCUG 46953 / JCM 12243 / WAL 16351) TaxID=411902 RepID=A8RG15_ENTBW|nr:hypothetical protein CLOBOL_00020 [Enterocloster bolteae ATCC BAA-613]
MLLKIPCTLYLLFMCFRALLYQKHIYFCIKNQYIKDKKTG